MSCPDNNPCDPCNQYNNCGCENPNTFGCTTTSKVRTCLGTLAGEDGESVLDKIEAKVCNIGKVKLDANDTCPEYLSEKIGAGLNIDISYTGTGCDRQMIISATEGGVPVDVNVKVSDDDTTPGFLYDKIDGGSHITKDIQNPGDDETLALDVNIESLISGDAGNQLTTGGDGLLKTLYSAPDGSETVVTAGVGVILSGSGTSVDPYIISTNPSIQVVRSCFDNVWRPISLVSSGNANVVYASGAPQFRYRFDGTIEFKGSITYTVSFGNYQSSNRKFTVPMGTVAIDCISSGEQVGVSDLKSINYIDVPQAGADQYAQLYGYIIRKSAQNLVLEFQSSFIGATSKSIVVNFEGAVSYPNI